MIIYYNDDNNAVALAISNSETSFYLGVWLGVETCLVL